MEKHPFANEPRKGLFLELRAQDVEWLSATLCSRGDKLCLVVHVTNFIIELRNILQENPQHYGNAATIARAIAGTADYSGARVALGFPTFSPAKTEPERLQHDGGSAGTCDSPTKPEDKPTKPKGRSSDRRRETVQKAPKPTKQDSPSSRGRSSRSTKGGGTLNP